MISVLYCLNRNCTFHCWCASIKGFCNEAFVWMSKIRYISKNSFHTSDVFVKSAQKNMLKAYRVSLRGFAHLSAPNRYHARNFFSPVKNLFLKISLMKLSKKTTDHWPDYTWSIRFHYHKHVSYYSNSFYVKQIIQYILNNSCTDFSEPSNFRWRRQYCQPHFSCLNASILLVNFKKKNFFHILYSFILLFIFFDFLFYILHYSKF